MSEAKSKRTKPRRSRQRKKSKRSRKGKKEKGFAVWRAVSLLPKISWVAVLSSFIFLVCMFYAVTVIQQAQQQLEVGLHTQGIKRIYKAQRKVLLELESGVAPYEAVIIDERKTSIWSELGVRFKRDVGVPPPFVTDKDQEVNRGQWHTALRARGIDFVESIGVGAAGEVSLIWPPTPAPSPTLIVGHYFDKIAWVSPTRGVILSPIPPSWQTAPSMRLPPKMSRRW